MPCSQNPNHQSHASLASDLTGQAQAETATMPLCRLAVGRCQMCRAVFTTFTALRPLVVSFQLENGITMPSTVTMQSRAATPSSSLIVPNKRLSSTHSSTCKKHPRPTLPRHPQSKQRRRLWQLMALTKKFKEARLRAFDLTRSLAPLREGSVLGWTTSGNVTLAPIGLELGLESGNGMAPVSQVAPAKQPSMKAKPHRCT